MALTWTSKSRIIKNESIQEIRNIMNGLGLDCASANSRYVSGVQTSYLTTHYTGYNTSCHGQEWHCSWDYATHLSGEHDSANDPYCSGNYSTYDKSASGSGSTSYDSDCNVHGETYHDG